MAQANFMLGGLPHRWSVIATATAGVATATKAAEQNRRHYITGIVISGSAAPLAAVQVDIRKGANDFISAEIPAAVFSPIMWELKRPIEGNINEAVSIVLPSLGAAVTGTVTLMGFTTTA